MKLRLEFDGKVGVFTVIGYFRNKKNQVEWSLFPCKSIALFAALPVTTTVLDAVLMSRTDEYSLILTINNIDNEEQVHMITLSDVPKTVQEFPVY